MTVSIDISPFLVSSAGVKTYLYNWLKALGASERNFALRTFPIQFRGEKLVHGQSIFGNLQTFAGLARLALLNRTHIGSLGRIDVFHGSQLIRHMPAARIYSSTIFDLTYRLHPELHTSATIQCNVEFERNVLNRCAGIICISESAKKDALQLLRLDERKLRVIYPGIDESYFTVDAAQIQSAKEQYQLERPYILFAATLEPRKNLGRLLEAYEALPTDVTAEFDFVVAGGTGWKSEALRARLMAMQPRVKYLGYVPDQYLPGLTAGAAVFAYPSLYEGFGLPVAQAMAAGCPVLTSANSSLPEVAGEAAEYAEPLSVASLRESLLRLLTSETLRARLSTLGRERGQRFRWQESARQSIDFFNALLA